MKPKTFLGKAYGAPAALPERPVRDRSLAGLLLVALGTFALSYGIRQLQPLAVPVAQSRQATQSVAFASEPQAAYAAVAAVPSAPTGLHAAAGNASAALSWTAVSGASGYNVYRSLSATGANPTVVGIAVSGTSFVDSAAADSANPLTNGTTYYYYVTAQGSSDESAHSAVVSVTPQAGLPVAGTLDTGSTSSTQFCNLHQGSNGTLGGPLYAVFNPTAIFPLLPAAVLGQDATVNTSNPCSPPYWNLDIFKILIYKVLGLLNYLVLVFALLFTVYAGILYLMGFSNEGNVKKARAVLVGTYTGLILAFSARLILGATIGIFADSSSPGNVINQGDQTILNSSN